MLQEQWVRQSVATLLRFLFHATVLFNHLGILAVTCGGIPEKLLSLVGKEQKQILKYKDKKMQDISRGKNKTEKTVKKIGVENTV